MVQPPNSQEIEKCVLGCLLIDKQDHVLKLTEDDFYNPKHREIYKKIYSLFEQKELIDIVTVAVTNSGLDYMIELTNTVPTSEGIEQYISSLKTYTMKRKLLNATYEVQNSLSSDYVNAMDLKNDILAKFDVDVYEQKKDKYDISNIMLESMSNIETRFNSKNESKLFTGFTEMDKLTAGLHKQELTILAARPGIGKTAFALQLMRQVAKRGNGCVLFSREMSKGQLGERLISSLSRIDSNKIRFSKTLTNDDWGKIASSVSELSEMSIEINDKATTVQEIRSYMRELKSKNKLDIAIVDYLQLCKTMKKTQTREREVAEMSWELKMMTSEFDIPIIVLSQLSRTGTQEKREPILSDLRDSGAIEQDASNVIFLHIPSDTDETLDLFDIKVIIAKQRNGPTGNLWLQYCKKNYCFYTRSK